MTFTADTRREPPGIAVSYFEDRPAYFRREGTPDLIEVFRVGPRVVAQERPTPEQVEAIMDWATDPDGLDWALLERLEDWDEPDER